MHRVACRCPSASDRPYTHSCHDHSISTHPHLPAASQRCSYLTVYHHASSTGMQMSRRHQSVLSIFTFESRIASLQLSRSLPACIVWHADAHRHRSPTTAPLTPPSLQFDTHIDQHQPIIAAIDHSLCQHASLRMQMPISIRSHRHSLMPRSLHIDTLASASSIPSSQPSYCLPSRIERWHGIRVCC